MNPFSYDDAQKFVSSNERLVDDIYDQAKSLLLKIMTHYQGSSEFRLERTSEFLDDFLWKLKYDRNNLFDNSSRNLYNVVLLSRHYYIPKLKLEMENNQTSDAFPIHTWN
jgi:hypothetical protein